MTRAIAPRSAVSLSSCVETICSVMACVIAFPDGLALACVRGPYFVIPAKAGIHVALDGTLEIKMAPGFRRDDGLRGQRVDDDVDREFRIVLREPALVAPV